MIRCKCISVSEFMYHSATTFHFPFRQSGMLFRSAFLDGWNNFKAAPFQDFFQRFYYSPCLIKEYIERIWSSASAYDNCLFTFMQADRNTSWGLSHHSVNDAVEHHFQLSAGFPNNRERRLSVLVLLLSASAHVVHHPRANNISVSHGNSYSRCRDWFAGQPL